MAIWRGDDTALKAYRLTDSGLRELFVNGEPVSDYVWPTTGSVGYLGPMGDLEPATEVIVSTPGQIIENLRVTDIILVDAANVTIRNCVIDTPNYFGIDTTANATGLIIEDCTVIGGQNCGIAVNANGWTVRRCDISGGADGVKASGNGVTLHRNYIHALFSGDVDPHHDGVQWGSAVGVTITENHISSKDTSCIAMFQGQGTWGDVLIQKNKLVGPVSYSFYSPGTSQTPGSYIRVLDNEIDGFVYGPVTDWIATNNEWSGNSVDVNGNPISALNMALFSFPTSAPAPRWAPA